MYFAPARCHTLHSLELPIKAEVLATTHFSARPPELRRHVMSEKSLCAVHTHGVVVGPGRYHTVYLLEFSRRYARCPPGWWIGAKFGAYFFFEKPRRERAPGAENKA